MADICKRYLSAGAAAFEQRHWAHAQFGNSSGTAVKNTFMLRGCRTGQNELSFIAGLIHLEAYCIPKRWYLLPFVDQTGGCSLQNKRGCHLGELPVLEIAVWISQHDPAATMMDGSPGFTTPFRSLNAKRTKGVKIF